MREGVGVFASKARYGLTPLRCGFFFWWAPRYQASARGVGSEEDVPSRCARWGWVFASKARYGLTPLRGRWVALEPVP